MLAVSVVSGIVSVPGSAGTAPSAPEYAVVAVTGAVDEVKAGADNACVESGTTVALVTIAWAVVGAVTIAGWIGAGVASASPEAGRRLSSRCRPTPAINSTAPMAPIKRWRSLGTVTLSESPPAMAKKIKTIPATTSRLGMGVSCTAPSSSAIAAVLSDGLGRSLQEATLRPAQAVSKSFGLVHHSTSVRIRQLQQRHVAGGSAVVPGCQLQA